MSFDKQTHQVIVKCDELLKIETLDVDEARKSKLIAPGHKEREEWLLTCVKGKRFGSASIFQVVNTISSLHIHTTQKHRARVEQEIAEVSLKVENFAGNL